MMRFSSIPLAAGLLLLAGCSLTSKEVEPGLPGGPIDGYGMLAFYADGLPVVANNSSNLGSIFGGGRLDPVRGSLMNGFMQLHASDYQNLEDKYDTHDLDLTISNFTGEGTYQLDSTSTYTLSAPAPRSLVGQVRQLPTEPRSEVTITAWDPATRHLQGRFACTVVDTYTGQMSRLTEGRFDLTLGY